MTGRQRNRSVRVLAWFTAVLLGLSLGAAWADHVLGLKLFNEGRIEEAMEQFKKQTKRTPDFHYSRYMTGICLIKLNRPDEAIAVLEESLPRAGSDKERFKSLDGLGKAFGAKGDLDKATETFEAAAALPVGASMRAAALEQCGDISLKRRDYASAGKALAQAARLNPESKNIQYKLGVVQLTLKDYEGAVTALEKAHALNPRNLKWMEKLGDAYVARNMATGADAGDDEYYRKGIALAQQGLALAPSSFEMNELLGNCYLGIGRYDDAIEVLNKVVRLRPRYGYGIFNLAQAYAVKGDYAMAESSLKKAMELMPKNDKVCSSLGYLYEKQDRLAESMDAFKAAYDLEPSSFNSGNLNRVLAKMKQAETQAPSGVAPEETDGLRAAAAADGPSPRGGNGNGHTERAEYRRARSGMK